MLQKHKNASSEQDQSNLESLKEKFAQEKAQTIDTEIVLEDRQVRLIVTQMEEQSCGCGGVEEHKIEVLRTVPGDSPLQDGDTVSEYDESDEIQGYV